MAYGSGYFKTSYQADMALVDTRLRKASLALLLLALAFLPAVATPFVLDLAAQAALAAIGALALNILTGLAGQISLGHAGFLAAGAFTAAILVEEFKTPAIVNLGAAALVGAVLGLAVGAPSLRLKGLYLALGTLAMHFIVLYGGGEYQQLRGFHTGVVVPHLKIGPLLLNNTTRWYYALVAAGGVVVVFSVNLARTRPGRAWMAIRDRDIAAATLGINLARYKLLAFVVSSVLTAVAGGLWAYQRNFVSVEAFTFFTTIEYIAMIIIGGLGSVLGAILGTIFVTLLPYGIDVAMASLKLPGGAETYLFPVKFGVFGLLMALFLIFEPQGLVGIWRRVRNWVVLWPLKYRPLRT